MFSRGAEEQHAKMLLEPGSRRSDKGGLRSFARAATSCKAGCLQTPPQNAERHNIFPF